ncbi:WD40 repeat-containing protein [Phaffia rhodozyma]|uniref:WD40 repeat-containing protein n=1 Tax=Phaffia rhodozyma TaxID=264483 RepID=A0A0F7SQG6_PHARH|nr:WD40 repeat-containing protein [Phaffia rhodozyma]
MADQISSSLCSSASSIPPNYKLKQTLLGHTSVLSALKFSPDGSRLASCAKDGLIRIWDAETGVELCVLVGHSEGISDIAFSYDSKLIASASDDKTVRIWGVQTGKPIHEPLLAHTSAVLCVSFNPQGNLLASGGKDECVWIWDVRAGRPHLNLPAHSDPVSGVNFNRDGTMLVSCSWDGLIRMWDTSTGHCLKTIVHEESVPIAHISFTPNGRYLLSTSLDSTTRFWNFHTSKSVKTFSGALNEQYGCPSTFLVRPREGGNVQDRQEIWVVGGSEDGRVVAWEVQSREQRLDLKGHQDSVISVAGHPTKPMIASASIATDYHIKIWQDTSLPCPLVLPSLVTLPASTPIARPTDLPMSHSTITDKSAHSVVSSPSVVNQSTISHNSVHPSSPLAHDRRINGTEEPDTKTTTEVENRRLSLTDVEMDMGKPTSSTSSIPLIVVESQNADGETTR